MVWSYHSVKELRKKYENEEEISAAEKRKLEKYVRQKKKIADQAVGEWSKKQLHRAEFLLHKIQEDQKTAKVEVEN